MNYFSAFQMSCWRPVLLLGLSVSWQWAGSAQVAKLMVAQPGTNGWVRVQSPSSDPNSVYTIQASTNLQAWTAVAALHGAPFTFVDPASGERAFRFYRTASAAKTPADDWKNQVTYPDDPFASYPEGFGGDEMRWVKFAILLSEPNRVYYQDSHKYPFHYEFAVARLNPFKGISRDAFDRVSLHAADQQVILGAILLPPTLGEYGIQFVGLDPYPRELVARLFEVVRSTVIAGAEVRAFYVPVYEQAASAEAERAFFESRGIGLASAGRWTKGDSCYSTGWALGQLKFFAGSEISGAYADGRLQPSDILLTDSVPAEVPYVAGIISLNASTPNSHVAILARSYGVPFVYLFDANERQRVQQLVGKEIAVRSQETYGGCQARVLDLEGALDPATRAEILALKVPEPLRITPKAALGSFSAPTDNLTPSDVKYFGGKAANYGFLRRAIPADSPEALALSFDLWDAFMNQTVPNGKTLRTEIAERLAGYTYPANVLSVKNTLEAIRDLITKTAQFTSAQKEAVLSALRNLEPLKRVRFRSSTNVEDLERFTGAGLYDSFSGCIADDQDANNEGPSLCDSTEANERGVFRAIQKVYASFYNDNAFLERLRHGVDESKVGMAVLVHYSTPDEIELANGVATMRQDNTGALQGDLVTQLGAVSVTNPGGHALPEVINASQFPFGTPYLFRKAQSSLVPLGGHVMTWEADYKRFLEMFVKVAEAYHGFYPNKQEFTLDFEYKKVAPGKLIVKQVRELPLASGGPSAASALLNQPVQYCVFQGELSDVFANHRLKLLLTLEAKNLILKPINSTSLYAEAQLEYLEGAETKLLQGAPSSWPNARYTFENEVHRDRWTIGSGPAQRSFELVAEDPFRLTPRKENGLLLLSDYTLTLTTSYATPVPTLDPFGAGETTTSKETVRLAPCFVPNEEDILVQRTMTDGGVSIETRFYWPPYPKGPTAGYTAPVARWVETKINGLVSSPITLRAYYSQTYQPFHHNFAETFIFEPRLEPGLPQSVLDELAAKNVQLLHVFYNGNSAEVTLLGLDGKFRKL